MMEKHNNQPSLFERKEECCGCSACEAICPVGAIKMALDADGFYYPQINESACVYCGQCVKICSFKYK